FVRQYLDMSDVMKNIINSPLYEQLQFRILVYNGDVDTVCNFLGDEWFVENIVKDLNISTIAARRAWVYQFSADYQNQTAGYVKRFGKRIDLLTVKGSGHYVPMDRPPQALQMLMNFIWNRPNYDQMTGIDSTPKPILPIFNSTRHNYDGSYSSSSRHNYDGSYFSSVRHNHDDSYCSSARHNHDDSYCSFERLNHYGSYYASTNIPERSN
uniref:Uncharacterized protein n=1 Tax=Plectus sambesii TaxID=2011161 RepID=A0A914V4U6_9BILA